MGDLPEVKKKSEPDGRRPQTITVAPHWSDHRFQGRAVLPAVEAMQLLAHWAKNVRPDLPVSHIQAASFDKFLELPPAGEVIQVWWEFQNLENGAVRTALLTKTQAKSGGMTRTKTHAQLEFHPWVEVPQPAALDLAAALEGECFRVEPQVLYRDLVPFGPGFQTIDQPVLLTAEGALAMIRAPELRDVQTDQPLGSALVLDAAFHAACVWSQRFAGVVAFPVGIDRRVVKAPTQPGETYVARIFPMPSAEAAALHFDIWILGLDGRLFELLQGVRMRDVSGGRLLPPDRIKAPQENKKLDRIAAHCEAIALIERATLMPFAEQCLSETETGRTAKMVPKRRADYFSSRLACKRLVRQLSGNDDITSAPAISTLASDHIRPACPLTTGATAYHCSVAHDRRCTVAVAGRHPIGVDVEPLDERILKSLRIFMTPGEQQMVQSSSLGPVAAAVRVWTIKEAIAKMLNIHLADAWARTRVKHLGVEHSQLHIDGSQEMSAVHQMLGDHLITLTHAGLIKE
ncbi:MAG: polyketide synthase dehydratase domain-containing protein [Desulfobacteraceae bacterium]|nr:polyketide synthase dehydratase domain-containing protein [Desulfobacteraceae bacterium]